MDRPTIGNSQLYDHGHEEQAESRKTGSETENEKDGEGDLRTAGQKRHHGRNREGSGGPRGEPPIPLAVPKKMRRRVAPWARTSELKSR